MDPSAGIFLAVALVALAAVLITVTRRGQAETTRRAADARSRGWTYSAGRAPVIATVKGAIDGEEFAAVTRRPAGMLGDNRGRLPTSTTVTVSAPHGDGAVVLSPAQPSGDGATIAGALLDGPLRSFVVGDEVPAIDGLTDVTSVVASSAPPETRVEATTVSLAQQILTGEVRDSVAQLAQGDGAKRPVVVVRRSGAASVRLLAEVTDLDEIERMARLAVAVARAT